MLLPASRGCPCPLAHIALASASAVTSLSLPPGPLPPSCEDSPGSLVHAGNPGCSPNRTVLHHSCKVLRATYGDVVPGSRVRTWTSFGPFLSWPRSSYNAPHPAASPAAVSLPGSSLDARSDLVLPWGSGWVKCREEQPFHRPSPHHPLTVAPPDHAGFSP